MDDSLDRDTELQPKLAGGGLHTSGGILANHHLGYAIAVPEIDEMDSTVVPVAMDPTVQNDLFSVVRFP
jgi:hypothetical protein